MMMEHDDGYSFGLGVFETMRVHNGGCVMLDRHMGRMKRGLDVLGIDGMPSREDILSKVEDGHLDGRILKVEVSERNTVYTDRPDSYTQADRDRGFHLCVSDVRRNETSPFTFMKSLQYGDSIMEKRKARTDGFDEPLFLNSKGEVCEGATTNVFFTDGERIVTPPVMCGLLPGTVRSYMIERYDVEETAMTLDDIVSFTGCFVTNSVLGIMPVASIGDHRFPDRSFADRAYREYLEGLDSL